MNVLIAWELGTGLGHLGRHLDLAHALVLSGHQVVFVVKDLRLAHAVLTGSGFRFVQSPRIGRRTPMVRPICTHADILDHHGMADPPTCTALLQAWAQVYSLCATDVVIVDHAPGALFAAKCLGIKSVELAAGFYIPPAQTPYPVFRPWEKVSRADLLTQEAASLAAMNQFAVMNGMEPFLTLAQALTSDLPLLASFSELDHYPRRVGGKYIGPTNGFTSGELVAWSGNGKSRVFVYLRELPELEKVIAQFSIFDAEVIAYCPDMGPEHRLALRSQKMNLIDKPVQMQSLLQDCDLVVTNGGHGIMTACVLSGVPVLVVPLYLEQQLMADCIIRAQIGLGLMPPDVPLQFGSHVQRMLDERKFKTAAVALREKYAAYDLAKTIERLVSTLVKLLPH